jgi:hypothetical protein
MKDLIWLIISEVTLYGPLALLPSFLMRGTIPLQDLHAEETAHMIAQKQERKREKEKEIPISPSRVYCQ